MQTSKKIIALVAAVVVLAAAGGGIWLHHRKTAETESAAAVYVSTVAELNAANPDLTTLCYSGVTEAQETKEIKADTSKTIAETYVKEGDTVKKGTPLFLYDVASMQLDLEPIRSRFNSWNRKRQMPTLTSSFPIPHKFNLCKPTSTRHNMTSR